ncbi:RND family efflux transporter MFP subunit [uncultured Alphaproteobacteria bacterium]|uniref:RND family efflux transporter MFP subunit n=1 Tax=uncultured Alphaproteobacteria bacterium TaxID=91750 RepID=A0A212KJL9_9PROT|nr:RND family efflux transporter MFP subunit [uncultured Alphaproteobacteria bacterium]
MPRFKTLLLAMAGLSMIGALAAAAFEFSGRTARAEAAPAAPPAVRVSVATVERREVVRWEDYSGRLEAVDRVDVRARVAGQVEAVHFREGGLVAKGDLLVTLDQAPYRAAVARAEAEVARAEARAAFTARELGRANKLSESGNIPLREVDTRANAHREADAALRAAKAALETARLDLSYTEVRAPVAGRVGRAEVTPGNLVAAGADAPVLTTLVSVSPIYARFDAGEATVMAALAEVRGGGADALSRIPVEMSPSGGGAPVAGRVQMIDNRVDAASGTIGVRAVFDNPDGLLIPGQFARMRLGQAAAHPELVVSERAVGTDQDKKFVFVVGDDDRAQYRAVVLGPAVDGGRIVASGLEAGERVIVNGLQRVRPGVQVAPEAVAMAPRALAQR